MPPLFWRSTRLEPAITSSLYARLRSFIGAAGVMAFLPATGLDVRSDPLGFILTIMLLALSVSIHEFAHAWTAFKFGDTTARDMGRMSLNPIVHIDLFWTILLPAICLALGGILFGGAKPVPVDFHRLRHPWRDMTLVSLAGPFSNLLLTIVFLGLTKLSMTSGSFSNDMVPDLLERAAVLNATLFVFNMIPIPPLDGSRLMEHVLPRSAREPYLAIGGFGLLVIFALLSVPQFNAALRDAINAVLRLADAITPIGSGG